MIICKNQYLIGNVYFFIVPGSSAVERQTGDQRSPGSNPFLLLFRSLGILVLSIFAHNYCMARMLPREAELVSELTGLPGRAKSVKRFERSNGLDTALYRNIPFLHCIVYVSACGCSDLGSSTPVCDHTTGQCPCRNNVAEAGMNNSLTLSNDRQCRSCLSGFYGLSSGIGCARCNCSSVGAHASQCSEDGQCLCRSTVGGAKCDRCEPGYFDFTDVGCK